MSANAFSHFHSFIYIGGMVVPVGINDKGPFVRSSTPHMQHHRDDEKDCPPTHSSPIKQINRESDRLPKPTIM